MMVRKVLLICGILAALLYVGSDLLAAMRWQGYSYIDQSVSELRAIGAPTRSFLMPILILYGVLEFPFAVGVWLSAGPKRSLRIAAGLLFALGLLDLSAYFFPMQVRENLSQTGATLTDALHLVGTAVTVLLLLLIIGFGANADGKPFRVYSYATIVVLIVAGAWAALAAPQVQANLPTPWVGVKERINIYGYMLWLAVLASVLWRNHAPATAGKPPADIGSRQLTPR
jgi:hypothetical protein